MIWLFMTYWLVGGAPHNYHEFTKIGPVDTYEQCWAMGAQLADAIQKDDTKNALGACKRSVPLFGVTEPSFLELKPMWDMACASKNKPDLCWLGKDGKFVDPLKETP